MSLCLVILGCSPPTASPQKIFEDVTGVLPPEATVIQSGNSVGGLQNDGDHLLVLQATADSLAHWQEANHTLHWSSFPIPKEVTEYCFGLPTNDGTHYFARKTYSDDPDWHRGFLVIISLTSSKVWLYVWKT